MFTYLIFANTYKLTTLGENMVTWSKIDSSTFPELITEFLSLHPRFVGLIGDIFSPK